MRAAPGLRAAACLLAAALVLPGLLLLAAGEAQAQATVKLVGTTGQTENTSSTESRFINDRAQAFTTGSNATGYTLKQIDLPMSYNGHASPTAPTYTVAIHNATSSGPGTTVLGTLTNPASVADGNNSYTTAGIDLAPNTTYFVVIDVTGDTGNHHRISNDITDSDNEDAGARAGWSIANGSLTRVYDTGVAWTNRGFSWKMAIRGVVNPLAPPPAPATPTLSGMEGTSLRIEWTATAGGVTDYDVRYRRKGDTAWTEHPHSDDAHWTSIPALERGYSWEAQVAASNVYGPGPWSASGSGHTGPARFVRARTNPAGNFVTITLTKAPSNAGHGNSFTIKRNGTGFTGTSAGLSTLTNSFWVNVGSANAAQAGETVTVSYAIPTSSLRLRDADGLEVANFTDKPVTNRVPAAPAAPSAPTVSSVSGQRALSVSWTAPNDNHGAITDYDLRYFAGSADPTDANDWIEAGETGGHDHVGTATSATITGLTGGTTYRVQVRAENSVGEGSWSPSGSTSTANTVPDAPAAPTVSPVTSSRNLSVSWTAPESGGAPIAGYELRYYAGSADPDDEADWVRRNEASGIPDLSTNTATSATVTGLAASTAYRVQVRATNALGWGPWSASGTATTNAASGTNSAPMRMRFDSSNNCVEKTADTAYGTPLNAIIGTLVSVAPIQVGVCSGPVTNRVLPMFRDPDGDTLTVTARVRDLPDNVFVDPSAPFVAADSNRVFFDAAAAYRQTDVTIDVTATDPHGASASSFFIARVGTLPNTNGAPTFPTQVDPLQFALNKAIEPVVLPAATGGDVDETTANGTDLVFPYTYEVEDLPDGLTFDAATRTISGTPTKAGLFIVTYKAGDADSAQGGNDKAEQKFRIGVGLGLRITQVRIVSKPTYDSDSDGRADTYVRGDKVLIDMEFNGPVKVTGRSSVNIRLALGDDDHTPVRDIRKILTVGSDSQRHGGETLRFTYTVAAADTDTDGLFVISDANDRVLFTQGTATVTHAVTGETADPTYRGLPDPGTGAGDLMHKVDGTKTSADIGPTPSSATVNGDTLKLVFDAGLAEPADLDELRYYFFVLGAGGVGHDDKNDTQSPTAIVHRAVSQGDSFGGLELTLGAPARAGDEVTLTYTGKTLKGPGASGKQAPMFRGLAVTNNTPGATGPALLNASVKGKKLNLVFDADLDTGSTPAGSAFMVETEDLDLTPREIAGTGTVSIAGAVVTVTLAAALQADEESASVSYEKPSSSPLRSAASGNPQVQSFDRFHIAALSDGVAPKLLGGGVVQTGTSPAQSKMALSFDEALDTSSVPATGDFAVQAGGSAVTVSAVAVEERTVVLTLDRLATIGTKFEVTWTPGTNRIQDRAGNAAAGFRQTVGATQAGKPFARTLVASGAKIELTYDKPLDPFDLPAASAFALHWTLFPGGTASDRAEFETDIVSVAVAGSTLVLLLEDVVQPCAGDDPITLSYTKPASSPLQGLDGADVNAFSFQAVSNGHTYRCDNRNWVEGARVGSVILRAKRPLATDVTPEASWFTVKASGGPVTVTAAAYSADDAQELKLSLSRDLVPGETVTVSYLRPRGADGLWDTEGKQLGNIVDMPVTNPAVAAALTAAFNDVPDGHDGKGSEFSFELAFSENFGGRLDYMVLRDQAVQATNARVTGAKRVTQGQNRRWTITVRPRSNDDVTVTLAATEDCSAAGAICTPDGRKLSNTASATVALAPARFRSAATEAAGRGLRLTFTKDIKIAGGHPNYTVTVDGESRDTSSASWEGDTVGLLLAAPVEWGETVTVAYTQPADGVVLRDVNGLAIESFGPEAVTNAVPQPAGTSPATGAPSITGTAQAGQTLTADTSGIADADGLTGATFAYQWVSSNGTTDTDISGATGSTYTLVDADVGRRIKVRVGFTDDGGNAETLTSAATDTVARRPNRAATGAPTITGTAQSGGTLTADTSGISDADGLTGATFAYQWVSHDGTADTDISGATGSTYTLTDADVGRRIKVRVSFSDDAGNAESLTSAATTAVLPRPLTASFHDLPSEHDGKKRFSFELRFGDDFGGRFDYKVLRDQAFQVTNGAVRQAKRVAQGQNRRWTIAVRPESYKDVTITLPAGSVTTESGRTLSSPVTATVKGPALLSVADARAREGEDAAVAFAVTLSRAAAHVVTVNYATHDGTATAGEDYTQTGGTLTFNAGDTSHTVSVPILDDAIDEGEETFTLKLTGAQGAWIIDDEATGTIENDDPMPKAWTARFGRTVAVHVVDAVEARLDGASESWVQLGGHRLGGHGPDAHEAVRRLTLDRDLWAEGEGDNPDGQTLTFRDLLLGSSFHLASNGGEEAVKGPRLSAWGRVASSGFDGREDEVLLDGTVTTATLGVDGVWKRWLTGLALAYSEGDGSFTHTEMPGGDLTSSLTSLHPYVAYTLNDRVRLWGLLGYGSGALRMTLQGQDTDGDQDAMGTDEGQDVRDTDLTMTMGAVGIRGTVLQPTQQSGFELALRSDVLWMVMDSAAADNLAATEATASRLRLVLEGSRPVALASGGMFIPALEVGLRHDGGDAETGTGVEVGGRLRYASAWGLSIEASVRGLLAHEAEDYTEWGAGGALRFDPGRQGRGFTASVAPSWGSAWSGVENLWHQADTRALTPGAGLAPASAAGRLEAELGYGVAALSGRGLLTPYARVALVESADQAWHLGARLTLAQTLNFSLEASRRAREGDRAAHELALLANLGF